MQVPFAILGPFIDNSSPSVGDAITISTVIWQNNPVSHAYQWLRDGVNIVGATSISYVATSDDIGFSISVGDTATNSAGSGLATSDESDPVLAAPEESVFHRVLTIDHVQVASGLSDFPVKVALTLNSLKTVAHGGHAKNASGHDILFYADSGKLTPLSWEIEQYDGATGELVAWVNIPSVSSSVDTAFYMFYGGDEATFQSDATDVWDANYKGVYHLSQKSKPFALSRNAGNPIISHGGSESNWKYWQVQEPIVFEDPEDSSKLVMLFAGMTLSSGGLESIGIATASKSDPFTWTEYVGNPVLTGGDHRLDSCILVSGTYYLYTTTTGGVILYTSTNLYDWTFIGIALADDLESGEGPSQGAVFYESGTWTMIYSYRLPGTTLPGLRYATSSDGITFTRSGAGDLFTASPDSTYIEWHQVIKIGSIYILTYETSTDNGFALFIAYSSSITSGWVKVVASPVFTRSGTSGAFDEFHVATGAFHEIDGVWYLFFQGGNVQTPYGESRWDLGVATLNGSPLDIVTGGLIDSTSNANNLNGIGIAVDDFTTFTGAPNRAASGTLAMTATNNYSIQAWIRPSALPQSGFFIQNGYDNGVSGNGIGFGINNGGGSSGSKLSGVASGVAHMDSGYTFTETTDFHKVDMVRDAGTTKYYVDGVQTGGTSGAAPVTPTKTLLFGSQSFLMYFLGDMHETRFSDAVRSADWLAAEYANQNDASTFISVGSET